MHRPEGYKIKGTSHRLAPAGELNDDLLNTFTMLFSVYKSYEYYHIKERIENAISDNNCKNDITSLGLKEWLHKVLDKNTLHQDDFEDIEKNKFLKLSQEFKQRIFDILNS